jgi:uncharacterized membrane protein YciS (DUF1049 family)
MSRIITTLLALIIIGLAAAFSYLNAGPVSIDYLLGQSEIRLHWLLYIALVSGWLLGILSLIGPLVRLAASRRRLREQVRVMETELDNLRRLPISDVR